MSTHVDAVGAPAPIEPGPNDAPLADPPEKLVEAVVHPPHADEAIPVLAWLPARIGTASSLDPLVDRARAVAAAIKVDRGALRAALGGDRLVGHALHPALTDLPIGFWTSAFVLDLLPSRDARRRAEPVARTFVGLGVLSAAPTVLTGWSDFSALDERAPRRVAVVHAGCNAAATVSYALSWVLRPRHRRAGLAFGHLGATLATVGGVLGGALVLGDLPDEGSVATGATAESAPPPAPRVAV